VAAGGYRHGGGFGVHIGDGQGLRLARKEQAERAERSDAEQPHLFSSHAEAELAPISLAECPDCVGPCPFSPPLSSEWLEPIRILAELRRNPWANLALTPSQGLRPVQGVQIGAWRASQCSPRIYRQAPKSF